MDFCEKLKALRKDKGLTQEELATALYVSRTAVSKWESGKGYPSIDSLKAIAEFFDVSVDDLLSGEKLLSIAEKENKSNIHNMCDVLFSLTDICSFLLIFLPLYPDTIDGFVYSVNLFAYTQTARLNCIIYWIVFGILIGLGFVKITLTHLKVERCGKLLTVISMGLNIVTALYLALAREAYATVVAVLLLAIKGAILIKRIKADK